MSAQLQIQSLILLSACGMLTGCGQATLARKAVYGTISGAEGRSGLVSFIPAGSGPATRARVTDGKYRFDESNGPCAGQHRVVVRLQKPRPKGVSTVIAKGVPVPVDQANDLEADFDSRSVTVSVSTEGSQQLNLLLPELSGPAVSASRNSAVD